MKTSDKTLCVAGASGLAGSNIVKAGRYSNVAPGAERDMAARASLRLQSTDDVCKSSICADDPANSLRQTRFANAVEEALRGRRIVDQ